jgi:hypothetical protein
MNLATSSNKEIKKIKKKSFFLQTGTAADLYHLKWEFTIPSIYKMGLKCWLFDWLTDRTTLNRK